MRFKVIFRIQIKVVLKICPKVSDTLIVLSVVPLQSETITLESFYQERQTYTPCFVKKHIEPCDDLIKGQVREGRFGEKG